MAGKVSYLFDRTADDADRDFLRFWLDYPRKMDKVAAGRAWARMSAADRAECLRRLPQVVRYWQRSNTERRFIPYPATFLNGRRWEDDWDGDDAAPATDLGQCMWNRNGNRDPNAGQCAERAIATNPDNGNVYCARHARSLGLKFKQTAAA